LIYHHPVFFAWVKTVAVMVGIAAGAVLCVFSVCYSLISITVIEAYGDHHAGIICGIVIFAALIFWNDIDRAQKKLPVWNRVPFHEDDPRLNTLSQKLADEGRYHIFTEIWMESMAIAVARLIVVSSSGDEMYYIKDHRGVRDRGVETPLFFFFQKVYMGGKRLAWEMLCIILSA